MEYLEVPFIVSYKLIDSNVNVEINGGVGSSFLVNNSAKIYNGGEVLKSRGTTDLRSVVHAGILGVGFGYDISKKIALSFEPQIKYFINSISSNESVDYHPCQLGLYAGVTYSFN
jgi:hypothetical protein